MIGSVLGLQSWRSSLFSHHLFKLQWICATEIRRCQIKGFNYDCSFHNSSLFLKLDNRFLKRFCKSKIISLLIDNISQPNFVLDYNYLSLLWQLNFLLWRLWKLVHIHFNNFLPWFKRKWLHNRESIWFWNFRRQNFVPRCCQLHTSILLFRFIKNCLPNS